MIRANNESKTQIIMLYSNETMVAIGIIMRLLLFIASLPVTIWIIIVRSLKGKSNEWILNWIVENKTK